MKVSRTFVMQSIFVDDYRSSVRVRFYRTHSSFVYWQDSLTGDSKAQEESREGDVVRGRYSLIEPDGVRRTVNYYADPLNGFNAVVQRDLPVAAAPALLRAAPAVVI